MAEKLFELIPQEHLSDILGNLHTYTDLPLSLIDTKGDMLMAYGAPFGCCALLGREQACRQAHAEAGRRARDIGEAYVFQCRAGLTHIVYPLIVEETLIGSVLLGPFLMEPPSPDDELAALGLPAEELRRLAVLEPRRVTCLSRLIGYMFGSVIPAERAILIRSREQAEGQSRINEAIQLYKKQALSASYEFFYKNELLLMTKIRMGDMGSAKKALNDLLGYALFSDGWNVASIRLRAIELTTLLSRVALEGGANVDSVFRMNEQFISLINDKNTIESISLLLLDVVKGFMDAMFYQKDKGNLYVREALGYIASHYTEPLRVGDVSRRLGLNADYFAAMFHKTVGESFNSYLMRVRVEQSKHLMLSTSDPLTDIAVATGFTDQSYYCRVFKKYVGLSPRQYRRFGKQ